MSLGRDKRKLKFYVGGSDACQGNQIDGYPILSFYHDKPKYDLLLLTNPSIVISFLTY